MTFTFAEVVHRQRMAFRRGTAYWAGLRGPLAPGLEGLLDWLYPFPGGTPRPTARVDGVFRTYTEALTGTVGPRVTRSGDWA